MSNLLYLNHNAARPLREARTVIKGWVGNDCWAALTHDLGVKPVKAFSEDGEPDTVGLLFCHNGYAIRVTYTWLDLFDVEVIRMSDEVPMLFYGEVDGPSLPLVAASIMEDCAAHNFQ